ncbi:MAG: hypothetical protein KKA54_21345 [Proteobacteria bacterium]|nr:hypothetical protein [Pseudomonadota bacterium]MBU0968910.1 hypothetical protein [Pseudomonadota bacterium]
MVITYQENRNAISGHASEKVDIYAYWKAIAKSHSGNIKALEKRLKKRQFHHHLFSLLKALSPAMLHR